MMHTDTPHKKVHHGRNIKRFREMLGIKQEALAAYMGDAWNQRKVSLLEQKDVVESEIIAQVAKILNVPVEAIQNFDEESAVNIIANTYSFQDFKDNAIASGFNFQPSFNPLDKMVELYERMLHQQQEMIDKLERLIEGK